MAWYWWVLIVAALAAAGAYAALVAWNAYMYVQQQADKGKGKTVFICDKHGPTEKYTVFPDDLVYETAQGGVRRGPVEVCVLCFEQSIKTARAKLPPLPTIKDLPQ